MRYLVIASCEDARTGAEFEPGDEFLPEPDAAQAERLIAARCLRVIDGDSPLLPIDAREGPLVTQLRQEIASLTDDLATARSDAGKLLDAATADLNGLRQERDSLARENADLAAVHVTLTDRVASLEAEIAAKADQPAGEGDAAVAKSAKAK